MTIDQVVREAAEMCGFTLQPGAEGRNDPRYARLERAANQAHREATRIFRPRTVDMVSTPDGTIDLATLENEVYEVTAVRKDGVGVEWGVQNGQLLVACSGQYEVEYVAAPAYMGGGAVLTLPESMLHPHNLAFYAASEFLNGEGRHTDAHAYDIRWNRALCGARGRLRMPFRRLF